jgi:hypothetical protein
MTAHTSHQLVDWQGYLTHNEVAAIQALAAELPLDAIVVKIGAGAGTDTIAILEITEDIILFSVDILAGESPATTNEHLRLIENGYDQSGCVVRIWGDSKVCGLRWPISVDFLLIDGDHSEEGLAGDIKTWFRHVKSGGFISFHDYDEPKWPAVKETVDKYMKGQEYLPEFSADKLRSYRKA